MEIETETDGSNKYLNMLKKPLEEFPEEKFQPPTPAHTLKKIKVQKDSQIKDASQKTIEIFFKKINPHKDT